MSSLGTLINGNSNVVNRDILKDTSRPITNSDYFDIVITDLNPNTSYNVQFAWVYPDDTRSDYSATYTFSTNPEDAPAIPSTPSVTAGPGLINVTWNGNNSLGTALQNYARVNLYVDGIFRDSFFGPATKSIALAKGTYSIRLRSSSSTNVVSDPSTAASATVTTDATDAATALTAAQQAALDAGIAQSTANGKNKVTYSTNPPGSTANTIGDIWYQYGTSGPNSGRIIAQYSGAGGTSWTQTTISGLVVANIDAGSITTGTLSVGISITGANNSFNLDATTGAITYTSSNREFRIYSAFGVFGIDNISDNAAILTTSSSGPRITLGSSGSLGYSVKVAKSITDTSELRNIYVSSTAGEPNPSSPSTGDIKLEW